MDKKCRTITSTAAQDGYLIYAVYFVDSSIRMDRGLRNA